MSKLPILMLIVLPLLSHSQTYEELCNRAVWEMDNKQIVLAITDYTFAILADSTHEQPYIGRALCLMAEGKWSLAIKDATSALTINPNQAVGYFIRGCAKGNLKQDGCEDLRRSSDLGYDLAIKAIEQYCR